MGAILSKTVNETESAPDNYSQASTDLNEALKLKFKKLHQTVVNSVNAASITNFLFQKDVLGAEDMRALHRIRDDPQQQCNELLALLHTSENPQTFIQLYAAIREESQLQWLVGRIDQFTDQSLTSLLQRQQQRIQQRYISEPTVGQVVHTLPEGPSIHGVTSLADEVFVLRNKEQDQLEVYDAIAYRLQRCLTVPNCRGIIDMTSCEHYKCVYIADHVVECIHSLYSQGKAATQWPVNDKPHGLSVNRAHNLLVACDKVGKIKEFSTHGNLLREIILPDDVINPFLAIQLTSGQFMVCHGNLDDPVHRVCMISSDGRQIVHSHGGQPGSDTDQCNVPFHVALDSHNFVFAADQNNLRVKLLSPTLDYVRDVVTSDSFKWKPRRLYVDAVRCRLYVVDNEWKDGKFRAGRVVVFIV